MRAPLRRTISLASASLLAAVCAAQTPAGPAVSFHFDRPVTGVAVPSYSLTIAADGTGQYHAEVVVAQSATPGETQAIDRPLALAPATVKRAFEGVKLLRASSVPCASKVKNIADTGTKTLKWRDAVGEDACTFNYSENKGAVQLTELFQGMERTLEAGRALDFKHRFDRLGLDAEMASLATDVEEGRALALETIVPTLKKIAGDTELIERVRLRAAKLLERVQAAS